MHQVVEIVNLLACIMHEDTHGGAEVWTKDPYHTRLSQDYNHL